MRKTAIATAIIFAASLVLAVGAIVVGTIFEPGDHDPLMVVIGAVLNLGLVGFMIGTPLALLIAIQAIRLLIRKLLKSKPATAVFKIGH
jgi:hypothetical protein